MYEKTIDHTTVLNSLLAEHHGWWCQSIDDTATPAKMSKEFFYASEGLYRLYNLDPADPLQPSSKRISALYSTDDQLRLKEIIRAVLKRPSAPQTDVFDVEVPGIGKKRIVVFAQRVGVMGKGSLLVSLHFEATANDLPWIHRTVLDRINAFVFVKQFVPMSDGETQAGAEASSGQYLFRYVNSQLAHALGRRQRDVVGKSDDEFFDQKQAQGFRHIDDQIRRSSKPGFSISLEEFFAPHGQRPRTLWTTKMKYRPPDTAIGNLGDQVLGIALDITAVTDQLRMAVREVNEGIFVQDWDGRVILTNRAFIDLLDLGKLDESGVLDKTFEKVANSLPEDGQNSGGLQQLLVYLHATHQSVTDYSTHVTTYSSISGRGEVVVERRRHQLGPMGEHVFILGICRPAFWNTAAEVLDKLPQCVSIKRYYPNAEIGKRFRVVWGNRNYLRRHKLTVEELGRREIFDSDLWDPDQAAHFSRIDQKVMDVASDLEQSSFYQNIEGRERWNLLVESLAKEGIREFREEVRSSHGGKMVFQTTKWPERIGDSWFLIVAYSDITSADEEKDRYHKMTVHTIRNATAPFGSAEVELKKYGSAGDENERLRIVENALRLLRVGGDNIGHVADTHLKLMNLAVETNSWIGVSKVIECAERQLEQLWLLEPEIVDRRLSFLDSLSANTDSQEVRVDIDFLAHVLAELLRNARKSVVKRCEVWRNWKAGRLPEESFRRDYSDVSQDNYWPHIGMRLSNIEGFLRLQVMDNGEAAANDKAWAELSKQFGSQISLGSWGGVEKLGVQFCRGVCKRLGGDLVIDRQLERPASAVSVGVMLRTRKSG